MILTRLGLAVAAVLISALLLACSPAEDSPSAASATSLDAAASTEGPVLSDALTRNCQRDGSSGNSVMSGLDAGQKAVDFTLKDVHGRETSLSGLLADKPVVMVFGSFT